MIIKKREMSDELKILMALDNRMELPEKEKQHYRSMKKGFEGELQYDDWMNALEPEHLILNDLLLEVNGSLFQVDSLVIFQDMIYLIDVKNHEGDYYYDSSGKLWTIFGKEVKDPLLQLKRSESLMRQLLHTLGHNTTLKACVLYINPEFALLQAPKDEPIILPAQQNRFMKKLNSFKSKITARNTKLAEKLLSLHIPVSPMAREPLYEYGELRKGVFCLGCGEVMVDYKRPDLICTRCGTTEKRKAAILRNIKEYRLLFPNRKITTNEIFDWCGYSVPKRTIYNILQQNLKVCGSNNSTYYE
jgi:ribosomal protein S27AE